MNGAAPSDGLMGPRSACVDADTAASIERGPIDPSGALRPDELERLLDRDDPAARTGWCTLPDGTGYAAVHTPMPQVSGEMLDWWFHWHPHDPIRYRAWFPGAHVDITFEPPVAPQAKPYWGAVHHPVEDIGLGMQRLRIRFLDPAAFGFPPGVLGRPDVATIICGIVGDDRRRAWHTRMCHLARRRDDGVELASRFWIGGELRLYTRAIIASPVDRVLATPLLRRRLVPRRAPLAMARHCATEYANLAALLPDLFARHGPGDARPTT